MSAKPMRESHALDRLFALLAARQAGGDPGPCYKTLNREEAMSNLAKKLGVCKQSISCNKAAH